MSGSKVFLIFIFVVLFSACDKEVSEGGRPMCTMFSQPMPRPLYYPLNTSLICMEQAVDTVQTLKEDMCGSVYYEYNDLRPLMSEHLDRDLILSLEKLKSYIYEYCRGRFFVHPSEDGSGTTLEDEIENNSTFSYEIVRGEISFGFENSEGVRFEGRLSSPQQVRDLTCPLYTVDCQIYKKQDIIIDDGEGA